jgi:hypothetical protein
VVISALVGGYFNYQKGQKLSRDILEKCSSRSNGII